MVVATYLGSQVKEAKVKLPVDHIACKSAAAFAENIMGQEAEMGIMFMETVDGQLKRFGVTYREDGEIRKQTYHEDSGVIMYKGFSFGDCGRIGTVDEFETIAPIRDAICHLASGSVRHQFKISVPQ